ncbi:MAG: ArsR family transcriptional regulator [Candidatus Lokiarchaeota archaeon]|nr:ArsR family transcriptional regulator [Candidatus Lokiarchaeota archaeon]
MRSNELKILEKIHEKKINIEDILSSKGRVKIIKILAEKGELNISQIAKIARINHNTCAFHLKILKEYDIVQEKIFGRIKIYRFKIENGRIRALKNLFELWNDL